MAFRAFVAEIQRAISPAACTGFLLLRIIWQLAGISTARTTPHISSSNVPFRWRSATARLSCYAVTCRVNYSTGTKIPSVAARAVGSDVYICVGNLRYLRSTHLDY